MTPRLPRLLALLSLLVAPLVVLSGTTPTANAGVAESTWCTDPGAVAPCIDTATMDGLPIAHDDIVVDAYDPSEEAHNTGFTVLGLESGDVGATVKVTMKTHLKPRVISMTGEYVFTDRRLVGGEWFVDIEMLAVEVLESCNNPTEPYCPVTAGPGTDQVQAQGNINDAYWYSDSAAERDKLHGLDQFSNINLFWYPPTISTSSTGAVTIDFLMENSHFYPDGTTVFQGMANVRLPNRVLREFYGIPNPETMVDGSFTSTAGTGTVSSYQEPGNDAWRVDATNITFSKRHLRLTRGVIVPTKPTNVVGDRADTNRAKLKFTLSTPRGANVTGYQARCVSPGGHVVSALKTTPTSPVRVGGLRSGVPYTCKVRARSKAGSGPWSAGAFVSGQVPH